MPIGLSYRTTLGFGIEQVYGTEVPRDKFVEFNSESIQYSHTTIKSGALQKDKNLLNRLRTGRQNTGGGVNMESVVNGQLFIIKGALGLASTITPVGAVLVREHTIKARERDGAPLPSYTIEVYRDRKVFVYPGCKTKSLTISGKPDDHMFLAPEFLGNGVEILKEPEEATPAVYPLANRYWIFEDIEFKVDDRRLDIDDFSLKIDNALIDKCYRGVTRYDLPENGKPVITGNVTVPFTDTVEYEKFKSGSPASLIATAIGNLIEGEIYEKFMIKLPIVLFNGDTPNAGSNDVIDQKLTYEAYEDFSTPLIEIVAINTESSI